MDDEKFFLAENILVSHIISATEGKRVKRKTRKKYEKGKMR